MPKAQEQPKEEEIKTSRLNQKAGWTFPLLRSFQRFFSPPKGGVGVAPRFAFRGSPLDDRRIKNTIELIGIGKNFGEFYANRDIHLTLKTGEIHALLGENGAGKSTLMKILYGLLEPSEGEILIDGTAQSIPSPQIARELGIAMVFQHFSLFEALNVLENIAIPLEGAVPDAALRRMITEKAAHFGLKIELNRPVYTLSAGERQRIEILRALIKEPRFLILDEPTSVLTPAEGEALFVTLRTLVAAGMGVVFISHKLEEVRRLCSRATILRGGKVVAEITPQEYSARALAGLMVGETMEGGVVRHAFTRPVDAQAVMRVEGVKVAPHHIHAMPLHDVDLAVDAGEIVVIAGIAGNGQSELYAVLSGEGGAPDAGRITLLGKNVTGSSINRRRRLGAAFVPEARLGQATLPQASLKENMVLSWHASEAIGGFFLNKKRLKRAARSVIERFDVRASSSYKAQAASLSGGNLQKYNIGREVMRAPRLLVINQPSWGVDARAARHIRQSLRDLAASGAALVVISQDLDEALEIADRILVMRQGRLYATSPIGQVSREEIGLLMVQDEAGEMQQKRIKSLQKEEITI